MTISRLERRAMGLSADDEVISITKESFERSLDSLIKTYKERGEIDLYNQFVNYRERYNTLNKTKDYFFRYYIVNKETIRFAMFKLKNVQN